MSWRDVVEATRALAALVASSHVVLPLDRTVAIIEPGRNARRRAARAGTRGRRNARRVPPCPMYLMKVRA